MENLSNSQSDTQSRWSDASVVAAEPKTTTTVLVVEDHPVNLLVLEHQLTRFGLRVLTANNGHEALTIFERGGVRLVFTDCNMPIMDGYTFCRQARSHERRCGLGRTSIIAYTGSVGDDGEQPCLDAGMDAVLDKPASLAQLQQALCRRLPQTAARSIVRLQPTRAAPAPTAASPVIDVHALTQLSRGSPAALVRLLERFRRCHSEDTSRLLEAMSSANMASIAHWAHRMKGACSLIGARRLADLCWTLEKVASSEPLAGLMASLIVELAELDSELQQTLARAQPQVHAH